MDPFSTPGGFLGGFLLVGIFLPITLSFVADGVVLYFRGRGPTRLLVAGSVAAAMIGLYMVTVQNADYAGSVAQMSGAIGLILWFSIPAAAIGFAVRMTALFLNPATKQLDREAIAKRSARHAAHSSRPRAHRGGLTRHA